MHSPRSLSLANWRIITPTCIHCYVVGNEHPESTSSTRVFLPITQLSSPIFPHALYTILHEHSRTVDSFGRYLGKLEALLLARWLTKENSHSPKKYAIWKIHPFGRPCQVCKFAFPEYTKIWPICRCKLPCDDRFFRKPLNAQHNFQV